MQKEPGIGIVAPSSKVPVVELKLGVNRIQNSGFWVDIHPQCLKSHLFFAGNDDERAKGFFEYAQNPNYSSLWCARGGHGSIRILPRLEKLARERGVPPKKLLLGYSDVTALMEFVRKEWGWSTLHAPMPTWRKFSLLGSSDWTALTQWIRRQEAVPPWKKTRLEYWTRAPKTPLRGRLVGGNLTVLTCLLGTEYQADLKNHLLFLEDVDEGMYRIDRMLQQLILSGSLSHIKAIVLGNFLNCRDHSPLVLKGEPAPKALGRILKNPKPIELQPLRKTLKDYDALRQIFAEVGTQLKVPVVYGLPVGHGPEVSPLPLGAHYRLRPEGYLELISWDWLDSGSFLR